MHYFNKSLYLQHMIIQTDILICSVFHAETVRYRAKLYKSKPLIKVTRVYIWCHNRVKLQYTKSMCFTLNETIFYKFFSNMKSSCIPVNRIAGIADMSAASYIVWMQYIKTIDFSTCLILRNSRVGLPCKKFSTAFVCQIFFLWKMLLRPPQPDSRCGWDLKNLFARIF